jgi:hypothetical protein
MADPKMARSRGVWGGSLNGSPFRDPVQRAAVGFIRHVPDPETATSCMKNRLNIAFSRPSFQAN